MTKKKGPEMPPFNSAMDKNKLKGYQQLQQDFFRLCGIRNIKHGSMLVLIYLRGLYCFFRKPNFYCPDKNITEDLGLSYRQLNRIRKVLQERGVIEFRVFKGRGKATEYLILKTELAPEIKPAKMSGQTCQNVRFSQEYLTSKTCQNVLSKVITRVNKEERFSPDVCDLIHKTAQEIGKQKGSK